MKLRNGAHPVPDKKEFFINFRCGSMLVSCTELFGDEVVIGANIKNKSIRAET
jgi:hypothetical protein